MKTVPKRHELYTEAEAAAALGISLGRLHQLLDRHVFNQGSARPEGIEFTSNDLLMLNYWARRTDEQLIDNVVPIRKGS